MFRLALHIVVLSVLASCVRGGNELSVPADRPWSARIAQSFVLRHPGAVTYDTGFTERKWNYEQGLMLWALYQMSVHSGDTTYYRFVEQNLDQYVGPDGQIKQYNIDDYNLDLVAPGRSLLVVLERSGSDKYRIAADILRRQLREQPRTSEGGFWHKKIYPYQMWLDGLYMAEPFYAMYSLQHNDTDAFDDIAKQFILIAKHTRDTTTGLYYHGWDERKQQIWADKTTGCSPSFWGRSMGWYAMGLVDVLEYIPTDHSRRKDLLTLFNDVCTGLLRWRDKDSKLWYLVLDQGPRPGNYFESSASAMFTYAFAKGVRAGYLPERYLAAAKESFDSIIARHVTVDENGFVNLHNTIKGAGLGGSQNRNGSFAYYTSEQQRTNDMKGLGPLLLAAIELEKGH